MQAAVSPSTDADSQIFTDGWDPKDWQQQQQQQQQQQPVAPSSLTMPQLYRPALAPPSSHPAFAAAAQAAGVSLAVCTLADRYLPLKRPPVDESSNAEVARLRAAYRSASARHNCYFYKLKSVTFIMQQGA